MSTEPGETLQDALAGWKIGRYAAQLYGRGMTSTTWRIDLPAGVFVAKTGRAGIPFERGLEVAAVVEASGLRAGAPLRTHSGQLTGPYLRFRWCVQAAYFAWRVANDIRIGIEDPSENWEGLEDARRHLA